MGKQVDGLISKVEFLGPTAEKAMLYHNIVRQMVSENEDSALHFGYHLSVELAIYSLIDNNLFAVGVAHDYKNELDSSLQYFNIRMNFARKRGDQDHEIHFVFAKGAVHYYQGNYAEAF